MKSVRLQDPKARLALSAVLLLGEVLLLTLLVDTDNLRAPTGFARLAGKGAVGLRMLLTAIVLSAGFGYLETSRSSKSLAPLRMRPLLSPAAAIANLAALAAFACSSIVLFSPGPGGASQDLLTVLCVASGLAMVFSAVLVFVPLEMWRRIFFTAPLAPAIGLVLTGAVALLTAAVKPVWLPWMRLTYKVVLAGLTAVRTGVVADAAHFTLGTGRFSVIISPECSGYEGMALMLALGSAWLWFFRREFRFPQALLLLPAGVAAIWALNCVRIIALILIGDAGAPAIAAGGFHSQAGWISFIILSAGLLLASQHLPWIAVASVVETEPSGRNETAAYLAPFLAILAAGMAAHAASAGFEWLYPLRVVAAAAALWWFRRDYGAWKWRVRWEPLAIGAAAFAMWLGVERLAGGAGAAAGMPAELAAVPALARFGWLAFRVAGAVVTVPVAEELAFRGYALRRLESPDFTAVDLRRFPLVPLAVSSLLFGALHGSRWIAGSIAGALYAAAARRRGSLADAAAAHAATNALLAGWVLLTGDWKLW